MRIRPAIPGAVIRFPSDPNRRVPDEGCEMPTSGMDAEHFQRLLLTKELVPVSEVRAAPAPAERAVDAAEQADPTGREPLTPITTR